MKIGSCHRSQEYFANNKNELVTGNKIETFRAISNNNITNLLGIMGWKSSDVVRFDLGPSFKVKCGQPNLKVLITCLLLVLEVCDVKPTNSKSWAGNLLMCSDLTLDPSFRVKQG